MSCARTRQMLDALIDGELDAATAREIEGHLVHCPDCVALKTARDALRGTVRNSALRFAASPALRKAVTVTARASAAAMSGKKTQGLTWHMPRWLQVFCIAGCSAAVSALLTVLLLVPGHAEPQRDQIVAAHTAALERANLVDVISADRHVIKPWFQGKIDFAPAVRDLSAHGFALRGARLDKIGGQQAVAVVYQVRQHPISLYVWRGIPEQSVPLQVSDVRGFAVAQWSTGGLSYAAISDVDVAELTQFAKQFARY